MNPFAQPKQPVGNRPLWRNGSMARSRCLRGRPALRIFLAGLGATLLLAQLIALANSVMNLRHEIDTLQGEKSYLEARYALRIAAWNRASSRQTVVARAEKELGLVTPAGPGPVIVMSESKKEPGIPTWRRVLDSVGGGGEGMPSVAAQDRWP